MALTREAKETAARKTDRYISPGGLAPVDSAAANGVTPRGKRVLPPPGNLRELTAKHALIVEKLVYGLDRPHLGLCLEAGVPLTPIQCADALNLKRRYVRRLLLEPVFQSAISKALNAKRNAAHPRALHKMIELLDHEDSLNKTAGATLRLKAAQAVLGDSAPGMSVTVNNQTNIANYDLHKLSLDELEELRDTLARVTIEHSPLGSPSEPRGD